MIVSFYPLVSETTFLSLVVLLHQLPLQGLLLIRFQWVKKEKVAVYKRGCGTIRP